MGKQWKQWQTLFLGLQNHYRWWLQPWNLKTLAPWKKFMTYINSILKSREIAFPTKFHIVKVMIFPVIMYGCESWTIKKAEHRKNWYFWIVLLEKTLESPLECKEIETVNPKGNQSSKFIGRTDDEAEAPILWPLHENKSLFGENSDAGKDWRWKEKVKKEGEMVGWHHQLDGHEFS